MSPDSVPKNGDGKGESSYHNMEGVEGWWSVSLDPVMTTATTGKVMSPDSVPKNGDGKGESSYHSMEDVEGR